MDPKTVAHSKRWCALVVALTGCRGVKTLFLGDPETLAPATPPPPLLPASGALGTSSASSSAAGSLRLPNGQLASPEYAEASSLQRNGQLWKARFVVAPKALGSTGTREELRLLAEVCKAQSDLYCVDQAHEKLGLPAVESEIERTKKLGRKNPKAARALLLPKLEGGTPLTLEEASVLKQICEKLKDKNCDALATPARSSHCPQCARSESRIGQSNAAGAHDALRRMCKRFRRVLPKKVLQVKRTYFSGTINASEV
jgi:hypothetical protein